MVAPCYFAAMESSVRISTPAREAWGLFWRIFMEDKRRRWAILSEMGLSPQQSMAISTLIARPSMVIPPAQRTTVPVAPTPCRHGGGGWW